MDEIKSLQEQIKQFSQERDWTKFHSAKNLSMALSVEVSELMEIFQWLTEKESNNLSKVQKEKVNEELADIFIYLLRISDITNIDLLEATQRKLHVNREKYPVDKCFGKSNKYNEL